MLDIVDLASTGKKRAGAFPQKGITVIVSSHILSEIEAVADDIGIITDGNLGYQAAYVDGMDLAQLFMDVVRASKSNKEELNKIYNQGKADFLKVKRCTAPPKV